MRKLLSIGVVLMAFVALAAAPTAIFACDGDGTAAKQASATEKADGKLASSSCSAAKKANATQANSSSACSASKSASLASASCNPANCSPAQCAEKLGMTVAEFKEMNSKYEMVNMNVSGMTCGSCEKSIKASLELVPGVVRVAKVCHKSGSAMAWVQPDKVEGQSLVTAVANKGFEAEIIPAVATATTDAPAKAANASKSCAAACASKKANASTASASDSK